MRNARRTTAVDYFEYFESLGSGVDGHVDAVRCADCGAILHRENEPLGPIVFRPATEGRESTVLLCQRDWDNRRPGQTPSRLTWGSVPPYLAKLLPVGVK